jgi:hypothetical protein
MLCCSFLKILVVYDEARMSRNGDILEFPVFLELDYM